MKSATLTRDIVSNMFTAGTLIAEGQVFYTLERPWLENTNNISCIPAGHYECEFRDRSNNGVFTNVYRLMNVQDREGVLIHTGNSVLDSHGCILIGLGRGSDNSTIVNSKLAMDKFREIMGKDNFNLTIIGEQRIS